MLSAFETITSRRRDGYRRRGVIALAAAAVAGVAVFLSVLTTSTPAAAAAVEPQAMSAATKEPTRARPKVKVTISRGQLNVLGTAGSDRITLRLKPGDTSRVQVSVGGNGPAEFHLQAHGHQSDRRSRRGRRRRTLDQRELRSIHGKRGDEPLR